MSTYDRQTLSHEVIAAGTVDFTLRSQPGFHSNRGRQSILYSGCQIHSERTPVMRFPR